MRNMQREIGILLSHNQYKYHNQLYNLYIYLNTFRLTIAQKSV